MISQPTVCKSCLADIEKQVRNSRYPVALRYCPHHRVLAVLQLDGAGGIQSWQNMGFLSEGEALSFVLEGVDDGITRAELTALQTGATSEH